jgi:hypothetical protein
VVHLLTKLLRGEPFDYAHRSLTARTKPGDGRSRGRRWNRRRFDRQQRAAERKQRTAPARGEPAEVANAREALGENMLQEPPQELFVRECHGAAFAVVRIVLPAKGHVGIGHLDEAMVGDGDAMRVAGQIVQYVFRPAERFLRIDHPVVFLKRVQKRIECLAVLPAMAGPVEGEPLAAKGFPQAVQELASKDPAENFHRQEKRWRG